MKKKIILILVAITTLCMLFACGNQSQTDSGADSTNKVEFSVNKSSAQMIFGDTLELIATYSPVDGEVVSWLSEDETVAAVNDGTVTATGIGSTRIKASYAGVSKYCSVLVTYGDVQPVLEIASVGEELNLYKGDRYEVEGSVLFNSKSYPCDLSVTIANEDVLGFDSSTNELIAKNKGTSRVTISAEWNGFSGALLSVETDVTVFAPLYAETTVVYDDGYSEFTDSLDLWINDSWNGESYVTEATLGIEAFNGNDKLDGSAVTCEIADPTLVSYDANTGRITVNSNGKTGETALNITINDGTESMTTQVAVSVKCPLADYSGLIEYNAGSGIVNKTWEELFGADYEILGAYQGENVLTFQKSGDNGVLKGLTVKGTDTESFVVQSAKGAFRFTNVDAYTAVLTEDNILNTLAPANAPSGYYIMKNDVTADFTSRKNGNWSSCFVGTFDGRGHTLNATVGGYGVFGSLGNGSVVKNTRFNFTFGGNGATLNQWDISIPDAYCGLAANNDNLIEGYATDKGEYHVTLDNLRIVTTNYKLNSYAIMGVKPYFLHMNNILVELDGLADDYEYTDVSVGTSALFGADRTGCMTGYADSALSGIKNGTLVKNVYFVTKKFMPLAVFTTTSSKRTFVWYANNDLKKLGRAAETSLLRLTSASAATSAYAKYFGSIWGTKSLTTYNPFIQRYDTAEDLKASGISKVGTWVV